MKLLLIHLTVNHLINSKYWQQFDRLHSTGCAFDKILN